MTTYYVSAAGADTASGTSAATAFKTLAKAQAAMAASSNADTTLVESGTYTAGATFTSSNSGDTIKADTGATVLIDGGNKAATFFTINGANNVTISGLTFQNTSTGGDNDSVKPAILVSSGTGVKIQGNTFKSLGSAVIFNAGNGTVDGNKITDMGSVAIRLRGSATGVTVSNNTISHSSYDLSEGGAIELLGTGGNTITHNTIDDSAFNGIWDESNGNNQITWNKVTNSVLVASDGGGIYAFAPAGGDTIANNYVVNSLSNSHLNWGIYLDDNVDNTTVTGNYAQGTMAGFDIHGGDNITATGNVFIGKDYGITVMGTGDGGSVGESDNIKINHNVISGQGAIAGYDWSSSGNLADYNVLIGTKSSQLGYDPGTVSQWQSRGQDTHSLLDGSLAGEVNADGTIKAGSQAASLGIASLNVSQVGVGGTSTGGSGGQTGGGTGGQTGGGTGGQTGGGTGGQTGGGTGGTTGGNGTPDTISVAVAEQLASGTSGAIHFIVTADGKQVGTGDVTSKYPGENVFNFTTDLAAGAHDIGINFASGPSKATLEINDVGIKVGSGQVTWTQDGWTGVAQGSVFHATVHV